MPRKKRARSVKDKEKQFSRILRLGEELLQENHGRGFSMRELARRLDMAPSNLYNYVKNENEIRVAILHAHFNMSSEDMEQLTEMQGKSCLEMMEALIIHFFESNNENRWAATELMSLQSLDGGHSLDLGLMIKPYRVLIEKAVNSGELPEQDLEFSALYIWSLLQGSANILRLAESNKIFDESRTKGYIEYVADVIISSLKSMPAP
jgi:AcrR family transcriptional regulator